MIFTCSSESIINEYHYKIALVGNPNVGKSTLFNKLTKQNQHTGNWSGKTVSSAEGMLFYKNKNIEIIDLPGTYSLKNDSKEEQVTSDFIKKGNYDVIIIVVNTAALKRSLLLVLQTLMKTNKAVLCLNMVDETDKKNMKVDTDELNIQLGIPVVKTSAKNNKNIHELLDAALSVADNKTKTFSLSKLTWLHNQKYSYEEETLLLSKMCGEISDRCTNHEFIPYSKKDAILDKIFTSKLSGLPITLLFFAIIFWLTAFAANYPSDLLSTLFGTITNNIKKVLIDLDVNSNITGLLTDGVVTTVGCVISVMLPPALIFFVLFALLEDSGYLPRIAFNLDKIFKVSGTNGKLSITMLMGLGCNSCGVTGCRIMRSDKERTIGILTNSFVPCNGRLPTLIAISSILFMSNGRISSSTTVALLLLSLLLLSFSLTLIISFVLSKVIHSNESSSIILELPPYRIPSFRETVVRTLREKVFYVLSRAIMVSIPAGAILWILSNCEINGNSLIQSVTNFFEPFGVFIGLDGTIITAFILGFPANEIVLPIILMIYNGTGVLSEYSSLNELSILLISNGWTVVTAVCFIIFTLFHFPCSTTCFSIKKETNSIKKTILAIVLPLVVGILLCMLTNVILTIIF